MDNAANDLFPRQLALISGALIVAYSICAAFQSVRLASAEEGTQTVLISLTIGLGAAAGGWLALGCPPSAQRATNRILVALLIGLVTSAADVLTWALLGWIGSGATWLVSFVAVNLQTCIVVQLLGGAQSDGERISNQRLTLLAPIGLLATTILGLVPSQVYQFVDSAHRDRLLILADQSRSYAGQLLTLSRPELASLRFQNHTDSSRSAFKLGIGQHVASVAQVLIEPGASNRVDEDLERMNRAYDQWARQHERSGSDSGAVSDAHLNTAADALAVQLLANEGRLRGRAAELQKAAQNKQGLAHVAALALVIAVMAVLLAYAYRRIAPFEHRSVAAQARSESLEAELEVAVARSNQLTRQLAAYAAAIDRGACISTTDVDGRITSANSAFCRLCGYAESELIGRTHAHLNSGVHPASFFEGLWTTITRGHVWRAEICNRSKSGHLFWVDTTIVPVHDQSGKISGFISLRFDVTELNRNRSILNEALNALPDGFVIYDADDRLVVHNRAYAALYDSSASCLVEGVTFEEVIRFGLSQGQYPEAGVSPADQERWLERRMEVHRQGASAVLQQLPNNRWVQVREQRTPAGMTVGMRTDVTSIVMQGQSLTALVENFPGGLTFMDADMNITFANRTFLTMLELPDTLLANGPVPVEDFLRYLIRRGEFGDCDEERLVAERLEVLRSPNPGRSTRTRPNGTILEIHVVPLEGGGYVTTFIDRTEKERMLLQLTQERQRSDERARQLNITLAHMNQGLSMFDHEATLRVWNDRYIDLYGLGAGTLRAGMKFEDVLELRRTIGSFDGDAEDFSETLQQQLIRSGITTVIHRTADGRQISVNSIRIDDGGWVATHDDITERVKNLESIEFAANHDVLTGLLNRKGFIDRTSSILFNRATDGSLWIILVDLDGFKGVNDALGHEFGDRLLKAVGTAISGSVRDNDIVARLGGDEFAVLGSFANGADALIVARRIIQRISEIQEIDGRRVAIGASSGVAGASANTSSIDDVMRDADAALYSAKGEGRGVARLFDGELVDLIIARRQMLEDLKHALENSEFEIAYQPIVALNNQKLTGFEALLRWRHPDKGVIMPAAFIPLLEETGLINEVGNWLVSQVCADALTLDGDVIMSINVSPIQLRGRRFSHVIRDILEQTGLPPFRLEIEITETVIMDTDSDVIDEIHRIKALGVRIALDDFGSGYTSLRYLRSIPFDKIKIDKLFVRDVLTSHSDRMILNAICGLARSLRIETTAEGLETDTQVQILEAAGVDFAQGYLLSRPNPLEYYQGWSPPPMPHFSVTDGRRRSDTPASNLDSPFP